MNAIAQFKCSEDYQNADISYKYYRKENPDIAKVEKIVYDMKGIAHKNEFSPNAKLRCCYYPEIINEHTAHLLTNGIGFEHEGCRDKLGADFDDVLKDIYTDALLCGTSYGYYVADEKKPHIVWLKYMNTVAILDDYSGKPAAYIYFTQIASEKPLCVALFEPEGVTEYVREYGEQMKVKSERRTYTERYLSNEVEGKFFVQEAQSSAIPVFPLYALNKKSCIVGVRENVAAMDLMASQLVNNVSEAELVYWILKNYGGMDDIADSNFIVNLVKSHVIHVDDDGSAEPHQISVPFEANSTAYARIKQLVYDNLSGVNPETLSAGNLTATAIAAAYSKQRNFSAKMESEVLKFVRGILSIAKMDSDEKLTTEYYETINVSETIQNAIASAPWLGEEETIKRLAILNGSGDRVKEIIEQRKEEQLEQFGMLQQASQDGLQGDNSAAQ